MHEPLGAASRWTPSWASYVVKKAASVTFVTVALLGNPQETGGGATSEKTEAIRDPRVQNVTSAAFPMRQDCLAIGVSHQA